MKEVGSKENKKKTKNYLNAIGTHYSYDRSPEWRGKGGGGNHSVGIKKKKI